jgi:hypothetical protein
MERNQSCLRWYTSGTIPTHRLKQAKGFRRISVKLQKSWRLSAYIQSRLLTLHSTTSNHQNAQCSRSVPHVTIPPLFPLFHSYLWSCLRSFTIPWLCLLPFHCKSLFHISFYTASHHFPIVSWLICCLVVISWALVSAIPIVYTPSHSMKDVPICLSINKKFTL